MFEQVSKPQVIKLTPAKAEEFLRMNTFPGQRALSDKHVNFLVKKMEDGRFRTAEVCIASNGKNIDYLMNGQHTCHGVIRYGKTVDCVLERYHCETFEDFGVLYNQFEGKGRTQAQSVKAMGYVLGLEWPMKIQQLVVSAGIIIKGPAFEFKSDRDERVRLLHEYRAFGDWLCGIIADPAVMKLRVSTKHVQRAPVVAAMLLTFNKNKHDATMFWEKVATGEELVRLDPEYRLREFLQTSIMTMRSGTYRIASKHEMIYKSIRCWNAFRKGETIRNLKYSPDSEIPEVK